MIRKSAIVLGLAGILTLAGCETGTFENYQISKRQVSDSKKEYVLKRPDGFTCTILAGDRDIRISQYNPLSLDDFSLVKNADARAGGGRSIGSTGSRSFSSPSRLSSPSKPFNPALPKKISPSSSIKPFHPVSPVAPSAPPGSLRYSDHLRSYDSYPYYVYNPMHPLSYYNPISPFYIGRPVIVVNRDSNNERRLSGLTEADKERIGNECLGVLERYLQDKDEKGSGW